VGRTIANNCTRLAEADSGFVPSYSEYRNMAAETNRQTGGLRFHSAQVVLVFRVTNALFSANELWPSGLVNGGNH
jgi:hypothetical protein